MESILKSSIFLLLSFVLLGGTNSWGQDAAVRTNAPVVLKASIDTGGIQNAAAWHLQTNVITPGEAIMIIGSYFTPIGVIKEFSGVPISTSLAGVEVKFNGIAGALYFVSPGQINVQVPNIPPSGNATIMVYYQGAVVAVTTMQVAPQAPGIFTYYGEPILTTSTGALTSMKDRPALKVGPTGAYLVLYGSGFGATSAGLSAGQPAPPVLSWITSSNRWAKLDKKEIPITYIGLSPGSVGLYQMNLFIPSSTPSGNHALELNIGGVDLQTINLITATVSSAVEQQNAVK